MWFWQGKRIEIYRLLGQLVRVVCVLKWKICSEKIDGFSLENVRVYFRLWRFSEFSSFASRAVISLVYTFFFLYFMFIHCFSWCEYLYFISVHILEKIRRNRDMRNFPFLYSMKQKHISIYYNENEKIFKS